MSNEQLTMYWGLHDLWGQGARGQHGSKLKLAPLTPRSLPLLPPCSQLTPSLLQLPARSSSLPACSLLTPSLLQLAPACPSSLPACFSLLPAHSSSLPMAMYVLGSPPPVGWKGLWGKVGASWSELGSELEWTREQAGEQAGEWAGEQARSELEWAGVSWSEPSEWNIIRGFRAPTTSGGKTSIITYSAYVSPPPGSKIPTQCPFT